jgi:cellulose/xylan binding protein with CBM9 domain/glycosyl hydrolase family 10
MKLKITLTIFSLVLWTCILPVNAEEKREEEAGIIWQLGEKNGNADDFLFRNTMWEYGRAPYLKRDENFNQQTNIFSYKIQNNGRKKVLFPQYMGSDFYKYWMPVDEVVTGIELVWNETQAETRKLTISLAAHQDRNGLADDVKCILPGNKVVYFQIPKTENRTMGKNTLEWNVTFDSHIGENKILIKNTMDTRGNKVIFDSIKLSKSSESIPFKPILESSTDRLGNVFHPGEDAVVDIKVSNQKEPLLLEYNIVDWQNNPVAKGKAPVENSSVKIKLQTDQKGYFELRSKLLSSNGAKVSLGSNDKFNLFRYVVIKPVEKVYKKDSPFGYHVYVCSMGRPVYYLKGLENRTKMAFLAGAKWGRIHNIDWRVIQPKNKETYDWSYYDKVVALPHKYKIMINGNLSANPKWASTSQNSKRVPAIGQPTWAFSPPVKADWEKWVETVVSRYKDKIKMWEIGNEPSYTSCFWPSGSPVDYAEYLKSAYNAAKKVDPECEVLTGGLVSQSAVGFLRDVLKYLGTGKYFDIHGFHYSQYPLKNSYKDWKKVLAPYADKPLINTEECLHAKKSLNMSDDFFQIENLIKRQTRELANGVRKTFFFNMFLDGIDGERNILHSGWSPRPAYAAYRTMTNHLEDAVYSGRLPFAPGIEGYLFLRKNTPVIVLWSNLKSDKNDNQTAIINFGTSSAKIIDVMDVEKEVSCNKNGVLRLDVTSMPVFIEGGDAAFLKAQAELEIVLEPEFPLLLAGKKEELNLLLKNSFPYSINVDVLLEKNEELNIKAIDKQFTILPDTTLHIKIPADFPVSVGKKLFALTCLLKFHLKGRPVDFSIPIVINTAIVPPGENILKNSDFSKAKNNAKSPESWSLFKNENAAVTYDSACGVDNSPGLIVQTVNDKGGAAFSYSEKIPVLAGEKYVLMADEKRRGSSILNMVQVSGYDKNGKKIFPKKPGCNLLRVRPELKWQTFGDSFTIEKGIANISLYFYCHHRKKGESFFDNIKLIQLSDKFNINKAMHQGECVKKTAEITIDGDLSEWTDIPPMKIKSSKNSKGQAECRAIWDDKNLYLSFSIDDTVFHQKETGRSVYKGDSVQFSIDPELLGKDYTDFSIADTPEGIQVYRDRCYATNELLTTMYRGLVKEIEVAVKHKDNHTIYELKIPFTSAHPLSIKEGYQFGFSWLVNDNDGKGRTYTEWSSGIGAGKNAKLFGIVKCIK